MTNKIRSLLLPLLSTLFFLAVLLSLNAFYTPMEPNNATPVVPITTVVNDIFSDAQ